MTYSATGLAPRVLAVACLYAVGTAPAIAANPPVRVTVDPQSTGAAVHPRMYGIFLEEINHGIDGGLYGELVRNRGFEDSRPPEGYQRVGERWVDAGGFDSGFDEFGYTTSGIPFWSTWSEGDAQGQLKLETNGGVTEASDYCARVVATDVAEGRFGVVNDGFFGIGVRQDAAYNLSLYTRTDANYDGTLTVQLVGPDGERLSNAVTFSEFKDDWTKQAGSLTARKTTSEARLVISLDRPGEVWLDFVSLFPAETWKDEPNGLRPDIAKMIAALQPGFVRFPGGCIVEGGTVETAYNWKLTVGPPEERHERWGPWNHRRTNGMGIYEYLRFCSNLGSEPLWVGFCGQTCIFRNREHVPMSEMDWVRDNFLDLVEYANGGSDTRWGAVRAAAGRPDPFKLEHIEIGNENQGREYARRYQFIYDALAAKYPDFTYYVDLSWTSPESMRGSEFDVVDMHYYNSSQWFLSRFNEYDDRSRELPPLYLGEVAVTSGEAGPLRGNLRAALAEGVFLMGCERNADVVKMVSYAPLLANLEGRTALTGAPPPWHAMIYFDGTRVFGTASYYLWKLFSANRPEVMVDSQVATEESTTTSVAGQIGIGTWDATAEFKDLKVELPNGRQWTPEEADNAPSGRGAWERDAGVYRQGRRGFGMTYFGEPEWSDYTLTLKARKLSGGEGFLITFGRQGRDQFWWNLGGWGNSQHAIEWNQTPVGRPSRGRIEENRWYDIKIHLSGNQIRCYLDGQLVHDTSYEPQAEFFVSAGRQASGELVVKAINVTDMPQPATLIVHGMDQFQSTARVTQLASDDPTANNSLGNPTAIAPKETTLDVRGPEVTYEFAPHSLSIIRFAPVAE